MSHQSAFLIHPSKKSEPSQKPVRNRLLELLKLEEGWLNGEGKPLYRSGTEQFINFFEEYFSATLPEPYLFPTPEGNLQAEWVINSVDITLDIDLSNQSAFYQASSNKNEETDEAILNLTQEQSWQQLNQKLTALSNN